MSTPGFTAETSLYAAGASYRSFATRSDRLIGGIVIERAWTVGIGREVIGLNPRYTRCGGLGESCCRAPYQNVAAFGPLVGCQAGLGCDVTTGKCVSPCGGAGQPCCDGPETRAPKWTADGRIYSPNSWNMREMCSAGACDRQTHRCFACGTRDGEPCCPPDAAQATARCVGENLHCEFDASGFATSGTCRACGKENREPCDWGCDPGLGIRGGLCARCGDDLQLPCDNSGCNPGLGLLGGLCRPCGHLGQVPCTAGCMGSLKPDHGLCAACGNLNQAPCDSICNYGTTPINGVCRLCGYDGLPPCATTGCVYPYKVSGGVCRPCGNKGQIPCDGACGPGLTVRNGLCSLPDPSTPESCASIGGGCVPDTQPGTHCCQHPGAPELCVYGQCNACIPHGEEVPAWGTQICCSAKDGDVPVLDQFSGKVVCGIPG
jgi:hypothetical protein